MNKFYRPHQLILAVSRTRVPWQPGNGLVPLGSYLFSVNDIWLIVPDQYQYLGNCPPTPPLTQQQSIDNNLGLVLR